MTDIIAALLRDGIEAFRLTREYVGEDLLPPIEGWSWFDWCEKARAALAAEADRPTCVVCGKPAAVAVVCDEHLRPRHFPATAAEADRGTPGLIDPESMDVLLNGGPFLDLASPNAVDVVARALRALGGHHGPAYVAALIEAIRKELERRAKPTE